MSKMWKGITEKESPKKVAPEKPDFQLSQSEIIHGDRIAIQSE